MWWYWLSVLLNFLWTTGDESKYNLVWFLHKNSSISSLVIADLKISNPSPVGGG